MGSNVTHINCGFCGKNRTEVDKLIISNEIGICNECIELCTNILDKERIEKLRKDHKIEKFLDPVKIKEHLDQYIIGQNSAKIVLSVGIVNHFKRIHFNPKIEIEKSNILIFGPSGSGKTLLAKNIAKFLNIPFVVADATTLTEAGYVGEDVESIISRLLAESEYDVERCEQGIIFIDEIDKISRKSESASLTRDVSGEGVQQALLKLVEGTKCKVSVGSTKKHPSLEQVEINTSNILFIAGGAFDGIDSIIAARQHNKGIGFNSKIEVSDVDRDLVEPLDFMKYGMIPEFAGRFPIVTHTNELSQDDLKKVLTETKNSLIKQMQFYFEVDGIELEFTDSAIDEIASQAKKLGTGARGLKTILEKLLNPFMFSIIEIKERSLKKIIVTEDMIKYETKEKF